MSDELSKPFPKSAMTENERYELGRETRIQVVSFAFMIMLTIISFISVATETIPSGFVVPFILLLGTVQFALQLFYFMHLKDKDHGWPNAFFATGIVVTIPALIALILLLGETKW
ncbi:cytochrome C oxidase subunit IV family protein [Alteribacillus iranensis]|uniref:Cytochrome c oxidase subunit 4 n=1 Tax=Alteribacillus iranensis TaxID=930128 RepID=A0A1I2AGJ4_9BACI|nr:cytochrome C oxidase subunit IV family protein [Alteribacillus iranensis]SFE42103.1 cytochrome c oxidase subunit 4 [Alteribacillus iranensis]